jgi:hypothetical protein
MKLHEFNLTSEDNESCYDIFQDVLKIVRREADKQSWTERYCLVYLGFDELDNYQRRHTYEVHTVAYLQTIGKIY